MSETVVSQKTEAEIRTTKVAACAVNLGCAILSEMIGNSVSKPALSDGQAEDVMTVALMNEIKL